MIEDDTPDAPGLTASLFAAIFFNAVLFGLAALI